MGARFDKMTYAVAVPAIEIDGAVGGGFGVDVDLDGAGVTAGRKNRPPLVEGASSR